eukprot:3357156-Alexandrium_andersonii.AAC.1
MRNQHGTASPYGRRCRPAMRPSQPHRARVLKPLERHTCKTIGGCELRAKVDRGGSLTAPAGRP